jgi:hypothetical protein
MVAVHGRWTVFSLRFSGVVASDAQHSGWSFPDVGFMRARNPTDAFPSLSLVFTTRLIGERLGCYWSSQHEMVCAAGVVACIL